jgi:hypothetical protein
METWYRQQSFFTEEKLSRIKAWMEPDGFNLIDLQLRKEAS